MNLFDYLYWRGDVDFSFAPFNEVDGLLLSQISYIDFGGIVPQGFNENGLTMEKVAESLKSQVDFERRNQFSKGINPQTMELFLSAAKTKRFASLVMKGFMDILDLDKGEQFSAFTCCHKDWTAITFRGTDGNVVGWKEDCKLGCMDEIPAQKDSLSYLELASSKSRGKIYVMGHSKGGNLAIYSATKSSCIIKKRLESIYNYDGPGFKKEFFQSQEYISVKDKINTFVPQLSIVGMLFSHADKIKVVESVNKGLMQHDPLSWQIGPTCFPELETTDRESKYLSATVNNWIDELSIEQRNQFVDGIFSILENAEITENAQFEAKPLEAAGRMISAYTKMDSQTRRVLQKTISLLMKSGLDNLSKGKTSKD